MELQAPHCRSTGRQLPSQSLGYARSSTTAAPHQSPRPTHPPGHQSVPGQRRAAVHRADAVQRRLCGAPVEGGSAGDLWGGRGVGVERGGVGSGAGWRGASPCSAGLPTHNDAKHSRRRREVGGAHGPAAQQAPTTTPQRAQRTHLLAQLQQRLHQQLQHAAAAQHRGAVHEGVADLHPAGGEVNASLGKLTRVAATGRAHSRCANVRMHQRSVPPAVERHARLHPGRTRSPDTTPTPPPPPPPCPPGALEILPLVAVPRIKLLAEAHTPPDQRHQPLQGGGEERRAPLALRVAHRALLGLCRSRQRCWCMHGPSVGRRRKKTHMSAGVGRALPVKTRAPPSLGFDPPPGAPPIAPPPPPPPPPQQRPGGGGVGGGGGAGCRLSKGAHPPLAAARRPARPRTPPPPPPLNPPSGSGWRPMVRARDRRCQKLNDMEQMESSGWEATSSNASTGALTCVGRSRGDGRGGRRAVGPGSRALSRQKLHLPAAAPPMARQLLSATPTPLAL